MKRIGWICCCLIAAWSFMSCSVSTKGRVRKLEKNGVQAGLYLPAEEEDMFSYPDEDTADYVSSDTLTVETPDGKRVFFMKATVDSTGTLHATEELEAIVVTARFKNIPERNGKVYLAFDVNVPQALVHPQWQVRLRPTAVVQEDTLEFDEVHVTGSRYRERQMKGYELYNKFLATIITDTAELMYLDLLETFIERNIPELAMLRKDSTSVSTESVEGLFGVSLREATAYYRRTAAIARNNQRKALREKKYAKFVKDPYIDEGVRVDTLISDVRQSVSYYYTQGVPTRSGLRKIDIHLSGGIYQDGEKLYDMPDSAPLTFYVSSFATLAEEKERFVTKVVERRASANSSAYIDFKAGEYIIDTSLNANRAEMARIERNIAELIENEEYYIDSLTITASCSPEGSYSLNNMLAMRRGKHLAEYFQGFVARYEQMADSLDKAETGVIMGLGDDEYSGLFEPKERFYDFDFIVKHRSEDWDRLIKLIQRDSVVKEKARIMKICMEKDLDMREKMLAALPDYGYIKEKLYPELRQVRFDFHLHRRGMLKDTIHTTVPDTVYRAGLEALRDRDFKTAVQCLGQYGDINSALAFIAMDYNASAMKILEGLPSSGKRDYMLAIAHSRTGNEKKAVEYYLSSVAHDSSMRFRGNLDPEISRLIAKYDIKLE